MSRRSWHDRLGRPRATGVVLVARREAQDVSRSRGLLTVVGILAIVGILAAVVPAIALGGALGVRQSLGFLVAPLQLVVALAGLLSGYGAIAGPRTGGQLKLLLGLPVTRRALVAGALLGRSAVVLGGIVVGLTAVAITLTVVHRALPTARLAGFGALLCLFGVSITSLGVGLSAACRSRGRAAVAVVGAFVLFEFFWSVVPAAAHQLVVGSWPGTVVPAWVVLLERLQPLTAFEAATTLVLPPPETSVAVSSGGAEAAAGPTTLDDRLDGQPPAYLHPWASVLTLFAWTVVPLLVGWYRFARADL